MSKSTTPKVAVKTAGENHRKIAPNVAAETVGEKHRKIAAKVAAEKARENHRKIAPNVAVKTAGENHRKIAPNVAVKTAGENHRKIAAKVAAEKAREKLRKIAPNVAVETAGENHRKIAPKVATDAAQFAETRPTQVPDSMPAFAESSVTHQFGESCSPQVPDSMRALAEMSVAQTRELYERSANALQAVLETWERSLDAAGQGAVTLNRKIFDIAERNISTGFDLAASLAGAKNLVEVMEVQAAYWRKQFGELKMQAEEVRALSTKVTANVAEPIKEQVTRHIDESTRRIKSHQALKTK